MKKNISIYSSSFILNRSKLWDKLINYKVKFNNYNNFTEILLEDNPDYIFIIIFLVIFTTQILKALLKKIYTI